MLRGRTSFLIAHRLPFGFAARDVKSYNMGLNGSTWEETKSSRIRAEFQPSKAGDYNALNDARAQAKMFEKMLAARRASGCDRITQAETMKSPAWDTSWRKNGTPFPKASRKT